LKERIMALRVAAAAMLVAGAWGLRALPGGPAALAAQTPAPAGANQAYTFATGAGALFFYVRPDRAVEFEAVVARLQTALATATDVARRQQAAGWRMYRSAEPPRDHAIYVFLFDPAPADADYDPVRLLSESYPADAQALYASLKGAVARVERMALSRLH
jgi:hypothetical protein